MILVKLVARMITVAALAFSVPALAGEGGKGGPFEAAGVVTMSAQSQTNQDNGFRSLFQSWKRLDGPQAGVSIPSQRPIDITTTSSGYGVRSDPFRHTAAFHAGVDMPGPVGTAIYATADGIVGRAGWASGYGNLVELQHGEGIATRYGHLSSIVVQPGQRVQRGQLIARMGSTGRSTGSHLHYEVRLEGRAVNPVPFLQTASYATLLDAQKEQHVSAKEDLED